MAIEGGYFGDRGKARYAIGRWAWDGQLGSSYDGYLQQEARYAQREIFLKKRQNSASNGIEMNFNVLSGKMF